MKIALCVSGHLRNCDKTSLSFHSFRKKLNTFATTDTFVSTWNKRNISGSWSGNHGIINDDTKDEHISEEYVKKTYETNDVSIFDQDFYNSEFSPLNYKDLTDKECDCHELARNENVVHVSSAFFLMYSANTLKKIKEFQTGKKYDLVIRIRPDYEFYTDTSFEIFKNFDAKTLYTTKVWVQEPINDWIVFGDSDTMNKYFSAFLKFSSVFNGGLFGSAEKVLIGTHDNFTFFLKKEFDAIGCLNRDMGIVDMETYQLEPLDAISKDLPYMFNMAKMV